jgi:hypothetical protein
MAVSKAFLRLLSHLNFIYTYTILKHPLYSGSSPRSLRGIYNQIGCICQSLWKSMLISLGTLSLQSDSGFLQPLSASHQST